MANQRTDGDAARATQCHPTPDTQTRAVAQVAIRADGGVSLLPQPVSSSAAAAVQAARLPYHGDLSGSPGCLLQDADCSTSIWQRGPAARDSRRSPVSREMFRASASAT